MEIRKIYLFFIFIAIAITVQFSLEGCKKNDDENAGTNKGGGQTGQMLILMTDAPADFSHVNVHIKSVQIHNVDSNDESGWITLNTHDTIYDLLSLRNNLTVVLANGMNLPVSEINQVRLILDNNNSVILNDSSIHPLIIPNPENTGIKINIHTEIVANRTVRILLDFDADESISLNANGEYLISPVIRIKDILFLSI